MAGESDHPLPTDGALTQGDVGTTERAGMVLIPAGTFWRGCNTAIGDYCEVDPEGNLALNVPYRELELSEFWIDKYEVTQEEYAACGAAGVCTAPGGVPWGEVEPPDAPGLPITGVNWDQARIFCEWSGKRLPTEAEWEKAARGDDGRRFPWGNEWPECGQAHLLFGEGCERVRHALPVDAHPGDVSPYGVRGMIGNVQEWVHDWRGLEYYATCPTKDPRGLRTRLERQGIPIPTTRLCGAATGTPASPWKATASARRSSGGVGSSLPALWISAVPRSGAAHAA